MSNISGIKCLLHDASVASIIGKVNWTLQHLREAYYIFIFIFVGLSGGLFLYHSVRQVFTQWEKFFSKMTFKIRSSMQHISNFIDFIIPVQWCLAKQQKYLGTSKVKPFVLRFMWKEYFHLLVGRLTATNNF